MSVVYTQFDCACLQVDKTSMTISAEQVNMDSLVQHEIIKLF